MRIEATNATKQINKNKMKSVKYILTDKTNNWIISRHLTISAAVAAQRAHDRKVKRNNGATSYIHYAITHRDGMDITDEVREARESVLY